MTTTATIDKPAELAPLPAPAPCSSGCASSEQHRPEWAEHEIYDYGDERGVDASRTCEQIVGTVTWRIYDDLPDSEHAISVSVQRYQAAATDRRHGKLPESRVEPAKVALHGGADLADYDKPATTEPMPAEAAQRLSALLATAAEIAVAAR